MKGVILAGGEGTRLRPATLAYNKQVTLVVDKPMIYYPLETLRQVGCEDVVIVSSPEGVGDIAKVIKDGSDLGLDVSYRIQLEAGGSAQALNVAKGHVDGVFPVIAGDVYFDPAPDSAQEPTLFWNDYEFGDHHSVYVEDKNIIVEKPDPRLELGKRAVVFYFYDDEVFDFIPTIEPSPRGEIELVDIHNHYLRERGAAVKEHKGFFGDMGTPGGLYRVATHIQQRRGGSEENLFENPPPAT